MDRSGDFAERLAAWIHPLYDVIPHPGSARIVELKVGGEADIECPAPAGCTWVHFRVEETVHFAFLKEPKSADGALLLCREGRYEAHVIECKRTVHQAKWEEVHGHFFGTLGRLLALAGVLGIELDRVTFGTAFRRDQLSPEESPNPTHGRPLLDALPEDGDAEHAVSGARLRQLAWMNDEVRLPGFVHPFPHVKIRLDPQGRGAYLARGAAPP
jgi:hypothetical protein